MDEWISVSCNVLAKSNTGWSRGSLPNCWRFRRPSSWRFRPIADIDLYIEKEDVHALLPFFQPFVSKPLKHYREEGWDLEYLQLIYENQKIEIGLTPGTKIFNTSSQQWVSLDVDLAESVQRDFHGLALPVINTNSLIEYKRVLNREVDRIDIKELEDIQQADGAQSKTQSN